MKTKHTTGPWIVRNYGTDESGSPIVQVEDEIGRTIVRYMGDLEQIDANARLIAAAPDMLAALRTFRPVDLDDFAGWMERFQISMNQARAAIAKATGTN